MKVLTRQEIGRAAWDAFCFAHPGAWFLWTSAYLDYQAARGMQELSFGIMDVDKLVAICPLFLEERDGERSFTMEGHPGPGPIGIIPDCVIENLAQEYGVTRFAWMGNPFNSEHLLVVTPWKNISWHTQIIDLIQSETALHAGIRKSYTSLINQVARTHEIVVDDKGELLKAFKRLHFGQVGHQTRPDRTWEIQREWCEAGNGLIVAAMRWNVAVACTYWIIYKRAAYYASSVSINPNVTHALVWRAILELKARGMEKLEMGWIDYDKSEKGQGIARFKTGFGGQVVPVIAVERRFE